MNFTKTIALVASCFLVAGALMAQTRGPEVIQPDKIDLSEPLYQMALRAERELPTDMKLGPVHGPLLEETGEGISRLQARESRSRLVDRFEGRFAPTVATNFEGLWARVSLDMR
jgi:hypothetical protein